MITPKNKAFAQIVNGYVHWLFTSDDLPEFNDETFTAVDVTTITPSPQVGWTATEANGIWSFTAPVETWASYKARVYQALQDADVTMIRVSEAVSLGLNSWTSSDVAAYVNYRRALRSIIAASTGDVTVAIPTKPAYPAGT